MEVGWLYAAVPLGALVAFATTSIVVPWLVKHLLSSNLTATDLHKTGSPKIPSLGGIAIFAGFAAAMTIFGALNLDYRLLFAVFLSATLGAFVGVIDDLFRFGKVTLVLLTFLVSLPIVAFRAGSTFVYLTPFGPANFGWAFWVLVPFGFAFLMNGVNIYAGFNGMEAGLGATSALSLGVCALLYGSMESAAALFALGGALVAFLRWNWFPAKLFLGGSGTFLIGSVLASSVIVGSIKVVGIIALFPYLVNFLLRASDRFTWTVGETVRNGVVTSRKRNALWALFMYNKQSGENAVVLKCILLQIMFGLLAIVVGYYHAYLIRPLVQS
jgi:UDP-N-acetylglucosamine--dolichyl-phosphate N-acetylglucosaminephosphotransferase